MNTVRLFLLVTLSAILAGCMPPAGSKSELAAGAEDFPAGNYVFYLAAAPDEIFTSPLFERLKTEVYQEDWQQFTQQLSDSFNMKPEEMGNVHAAVAMPNLFAQEPPDMIVSIDGAFTMESIRAMLEEELVNPDEDDALIQEEITLEDDSYAGVDYIKQITSSQMSEVVMNFMAADSQMVLATEESLKAFIDLRNGEGERLNSDADVKAAMRMINPDAQIALLFWKVNSTIGPMIHMAASMSENEQEVEMMKKFANIETLAISVVMTDGLLVETKVNFGEAETAEELIALYEVFIADAPENFSDDAGDDAMEMGLTEEQMKELLTNIKATHQGSVATFTLDLKGDSELLNMMIEEMKTQRQEWEEGETPVEEPEAAEQTEPAA